MENFGYVGDAIDAAGKTKRTTRVTGLFLWLFPTRYRRRPLRARIIQVVNIPLATTECVLTFPTYANRIIRSIRSNYYTRYRQHGFNDNTLLCLSVFPPPLVKIDIACLNALSLRHATILFQNTTYPRDSRCIYWFSHRTRTFSKQCRVRTYRNFSSPPLVSDSNTSNIEYLDAAALFHRDADKTYDKFMIRYLQNEYLPVKKDSIKWFLNIYIYDKTNIYLFVYAVLLFDDDF